MDYRQNVVPESAVPFDELDPREATGMFSLPSATRRPFASWLEKYMTDNNFSEVDIAFFTQLSKEAVIKWRKGRGPGLDKEHRYREALTTYAPMFRRFRDVCRNIRYTGKP